VLAIREELKAEAMDELHRILQSSAFRSSPRCQQFLRFVVEQAVEGHHELLKERMIGIEVFGRDPSYQTEGDSVVRVRATDVRRRLMQYYSTAGNTVSLRIDIPSGSYVPTFLAGADVLADPKRDEAEEAPESEIKPEFPQLPSAATAEAASPRRRYRWYTVLVVCLVTVLAALGIKNVFDRHKISSVATADSVLQQFWSPAITESKPILICIGSPITYTYSKMYRAEYLRENHLEEQQTQQVAILPADPAVAKANVVPVLHQYVGAGDANAATILSTLFGRLGKVTEFRIAPETSYAELSDTPTVLIGAFTNRWTIDAMNATPFGFREKDSTFVIEERSGQKRIWTPPQIRFDGKTEVDYAIVSRLLDSKTGQFLVTAAGITNYGSQAAGYFLTRPELLSKGLKGAPSDWDRKNIQFVLKTQIVDGSPTAPEVVAREVW
jgi:hypothetical protein